MELTHEPLPEMCQPQNSSFFNQENMKKLEQIMYPYEFNVGSTLFREGDSADFLYYIFSGKVKIMKLSEEGKEYITSIYYEGDFFGQIDPFHESKHHSTAVAIENCNVGAIQKSDLEELFWQYGDLPIEFMKWMGYQKRIIETKYRDLTMYGKPGALCSTLIRLSNSFGVMGEGDIRITLKLTNSELADFIGCARESVNRMLSDLKKAGAIAMNDGYIHITDLAYLQSICRCEMCPKELCRI